MNRCLHTAPADRVAHSVPSPRTAACILTALLAGTGACAGEAAGLLPAGQKAAVTCARNLTYSTIPHDPERDRHQLDVYSPKGRKNCPVLFFVHGGGWVLGGKDDVLGIYGYGTVARCLAERGLVVVLPNYRLSPGVRHSEHIRDIAHAFAWTCENIGRYGGDPERIFVGGHSAGGHLVALLATDLTYLKTVGRDTHDIRGVIAVSGVYRLEDFDLKWSAGICPGLKWSVQVDPLAPIFGTDPEVRRQASPIYQVREGLPPFLLLNGGFDYCPLRHMATDFAAALQKKGCAVRSETIPWRTHETLVFDILRQTTEPQLVEAVVGFVGQCPKATAHGR